MDKVISEQTRLSIIREIVRANRSASAMTVEMLERRILFTWTGAVSGSTNDTSHQYDLASNWSSGAVEDSFAGTTFSSSTTLYLASSRTTVAAGLNLTFGGGFDLTIKSTNSTVKVLTLAGDISAASGGSNVIIGDATNPLSIALGAATRTFNVSTTQNFTLVNPISGAVGITKTGAGTLTLPAINTYTGTTTLSAGQINLNNAKALGTGTFAINGGAIDNTSGASITLSNTNPQTFGGDFSFLGSSALNMGTGAVTLTGTRTITTSGSSALTEGGIISGAFGLTKAGTGILTLVGANTFTGTMNLSAGQLNINSTKATGAGAFVIGAGTTIDATNGAITLANTIAETWSGDFTFLGTSALNLGTGAITLAGNRNVTISGSTLTVGGAIGDAGFGFSLDKLGAGTLTLSVANTFTGGTTLGAGQLNINNAAALGSGIFEIDGGTIDNTSAANITLSTNNALLWAGDFTFVGTKSLNVGTGAVTLSGSRNVSVTTAASTLTLGGSVGDGGANYSLTKSGAGILALAASGTYKGGTTIAAGTVNFVNGALGTGAISFVTGGILQWATGNTQDVSGSIAPVGNGVIATLDTGSNVVVFATGISGQGAIAKAGSGTLTLSIANTLSGGITLSVGTLNINDAAALGSGLFTINGGTINNSSAASIVLSTNNAITIGGNFTFTGTKNLDLGTGAVSLTGARTITASANTLAIGGVISGAFALTKAGTSGLLTLYGANTYSGGTVVSQGTLNINNASAIGTGTLTMSGGTINNTSGAAITLSTNNAVLLSSTLTFTGTNNLNLGTGAVTLTAARSITPNAGILTIGGVIGGAFAMTKAGNGTLVLTNANTYASTTLTTGTLAINNANGIGTGTFTISGGTIDNTSGTPITLATNNAQTWGGTVTIANGNNINLGTGAITLTAARQITVTAGVYTVAGVISGAFALSKAGNGTLVPTATNTYSGGTVLNGGVLNLNDPSNIGTGALSLTSGTLDNTSGSAMTLTNNITLSGNFTFAGSNNLTLSTGTVTLTGNRQITTTAGLLTIAGNISGSFSLTKLGAGKLALSGSNTYTGGTGLSAGELDINSASAIGTGTLTLTAGTFDNTSGSAITLSTNNLQSWAGSVTFAGSNNLTFGTGNITLTGSRTLTTTAGTLTENGVIGGSFSLTKAGAGTLTLIGASTYTLGTIINAGTVNANNSTGSATGTGAVTVNNTGTLAGTGKSSGAVTVNSGGTLTPGVNNTAIFNTGNLILNSGSNLNITLNGDVAGTDYDQVNVTGTVSIASGVLNLSGTRIAHSAAYLTIINNDAADAVTGTFSGKAQGSITTYNGVDYSNNYLGGTGNDFVLGANLAPTSTTIDPGSGTATVYGQSVTFTANVNDAASGSPTGSVSFLDGATVLGSATLDAFDVATFTTTALIVGNRSITAVYGGDASFAGSTSPGTASQTVNQASSSTAIQSSAASNRVGEDVTFTATVTANAPGGGIATGNITFFDGATAIGTSTLDATGAATLDITTLSAGSHSITASYVGDSNFIASASSAITQTVQQSTTTTALTSTGGPTVVGQNITFTAMLAVDAPGGGVPTGTVQFKDGSAIVATALLDGTGTASVDITSLGAGNHSITAVYVGTSDYAGSTSNALTPQVNQSTTTTSIASSVNSSTYGQSTTFTVAVLIDAPGGGTATGTITFKDGSTTLGSGVLDGSGQATFNIANLSAGMHSIVASYAGDSNYVASASSPLTQTVNQSATSTSVTSNANPSVFGQSVTFTANVAATAPGGGIPAGPVTFKDGSTTIGAGTLDASGVATLSTSSLTVASHSITAIYAGNANYTTSSSSAVVQQVNQASTSGTLTSSITPSVFGQSTTFTVAIAPVAPGAGTPTGTVDFKDGSTLLGTVTLDGTGRASISTATLSVGSHAMSAVYSGDSRFTGNTSTQTQVVNQSSTSTSLASSANPAVHGQPITITATVATTAPGAGVPTGTVTFNLGAYVLGTATLDSAGRATYSNSAAGVGTYAITATYAGDTNDQTSTSPTLTQTVNAASTTTSLATSLTPGVFGQSVRFTATVATVSPGSGTATGTVTFQDGSTTIGSGTLDGSGTATLDIASLAVGSHTITAIYGGDSSSTASTSSTLTQTVNAAATTSTVSSSSAPSVFGQTVTFTGHVSVNTPGAGTPTGNITFKDGSTTLGTVALNASGDATFSTATLTTTSHSITAIYAGDSSFSTSASSALTQTVNAAATSTTISSSSAPSVFGQSVTFTATVATTSPGSGTATGTVTFKDGSTTIGTGTLNGSGVATFASASLSVGSHSITANYGGTTNFVTSTSAVQTQTVDQSSTSVSVASSASPSQFGQSIAFTAHVAPVSPGAGTPSGTIALKDGSTTLGTGTVNASGDATFNTASLSIGIHSITVVYGGDTDFATSTSATLTQTVQSDATTIAIISSVSPSAFGQTVTFTATVSVTSPGAGVETGSVTFKDGSLTLGTGTVNSSGVATFSTAALSVASHSITAVYGGDLNFNASTSPTLTQVVQAASTTTTVNESVNPSMFGQAVTITATVAVVAPGDGTPSGSVTFKDGATTIGTGTLDSSGVATFTTTSLAVGSHSITAVYLGTANFATSTSAASSQVVQRASTVATLSDSTDPTVFGQSTTFTAHIDVTAPGSGTPTGSITFTDGSTVLGVVALNASDDATLVISNLTVGSHTITAAYAGDSSFVASTSSASTHDVDQASTNSTLSSSSAPSVFGQPITFTASVTTDLPGNGTPSGTVTFKDGTTTLGTAVLDASGTARFSTAALDVATHSITAIFGGSADQAASTSLAFSQQVQRASTSSTVSTSSNASAFGEAVTFTATVLATTPGLGTPGGTINFNDGSTLLGTATLDASGQTTFSTSSLSVGSHSITVAYAGNTRYAGSTSASIAQTVHADSTAVVLTSSASPSSFGQSVTFTASISVASQGSGMLTGTVTFKDGSTTFGTGTVDASGVATLGTTALSVGGHSITAVYSGDSSFVGSTSGTVTQTVQQAATSTTIASAVNPSVFGQATTFTATVTTTAPGNGTASGIVTFKDGTMTLGTGTLNSSGVASFSTNALAVGTHSITAVYGGSTNFTNSTSTTFTQTVNQADTSTTINSSSNNPSVFGQSTTLTAHVAATSPGAGIASGTVTFKEGTTTLGAGTLNASGDATFSFATLSIGSHSIIAVYGGDSSFNASTSPTITQEVDQATTTTSLTSSNAPSVFGQSTTLTATVTASLPGHGIPGGTIAFKEGSLVLGTVALDGSGIASLAISSLSTGSHSIRAIYSGNGNFIASSSSTLTQQVNRAATSGTIASQNSSSAFGETITFTTTIIATAPGAGIPSGTVDFKDGSTLIGTATLDSAGHASVSTSSLDVGSHTITAVYSGDSNFAGSTSTTSQTVARDASTVTLVSSANPTVYGQAMTITATVAAGAPGSGTPSGTITFKSGSTILETATLDSSGQATFTNSTAPVGSYSITAVYAGDVDFGGCASAPLTQTVNQASTTTALTVSPTSSAVGESIRLTARVDAVAPGSGIAGGTVTFMDGSEVVGTATLNSSGTAILDLANLSVGNHTLSAAYGGNSDFDGSTSSTVMQTVAAATTSTTITSSSSQSVFGEAVTFTASVDVNSPGAGEPGGTITFFDGSTAIGNGTLDRHGNCSLTISDLAVDTHDITAVYAGNGNFSTSSSSPLTMTVGRASTTTTLSSSDDSTTTGDSITFTATVEPVAPGVGVATNTVTFMDGSNVLGTATLDGSDIATFTTSSLSLGSHSITAVYDGDTDFAASASPAVSQMVSASGTTTTLTTSDASAVFGETITYSAAVIASDSNAGTPSGTVTFKDGDTVLEIALLDSNGDASIDVDDLEIGDHAVTATFSPTAEFSSSTSAAIAQTIGQAATSLSLNSASSSAALGDAVSIVATITVDTPGAGSPGGVVMFHDGDLLLGNANLDSSGHATLTTNSLPAGNHTITADYAGDDDFAASSATAVRQVDKGNPTAAVTLSRSSTTVGQSLTFIAQVSSNLFGVPSGDVTFFDGNTAIGTSRLSGSGRAMLDVSSLRVGLHSIHVLYAGDANFNSTDSPTMLLTVNAAGSDQNAPPTLLTPAFASALVNNKSTTLSALGSDDAGEGRLTYTWSLIDRPAGSKTRLSINGNNAAKQTTATFDRAGRYSFIVTITDADGAAVTSSVSIDVAQELTRVQISPADSRLSVGATLQFSAVAVDQFGDVIASSPAARWSLLKGEGTIDDRGLFTAKSTEGSATVGATIGNQYASAIVTFVALGRPAASAAFTKIFGDASVGSVRNELFDELKPQSLLPEPEVETATQRATISRMVAPASIAFQPAAAEDDEPQTVEADSVDSTAQSADPPAQPAAGKGETPESPTPTKKDDAPDAKPIRFAVPDLGPIMLAPETVPDKVAMAKVPGGFAAGLLLLTNAAAAFFRGRSSRTNGVSSENVESDESTIDNVVSARHETSRRRIAPRTQ